jgi:hypothetical protein
VRICPGIVPGTHDGRVPLAAKGRNPDDYHPRLPVAARARILPVSRANLRMTKEGLAPVLRVGNTAEAAGGDPFGNRVRVVSLDKIPLPGIAPS